MLFYDYLVFLNFANSKVVRFRMSEIQSGNAGGGQHGQALGQLDPGLLLYLEQLPHGDLLAVVGLDQVARSGTDPRVLDLQQVLALQILRTENILIFRECIENIYVYKMQYLS